MTNKSIIKKSIAIILAIVSLCSCFVFSASAATSGNSGWSRTIQVWTNKTGSTPSITIKQNKGTFAWYSLTGRKVTKNMYGYYNITIKPVCKIDGSRTTYKTTKQVMEGGSIKLNLKKDTYYEITVSPNYVKSLEKAVGWTTVYNPAKGINWQNNSTWYVSKTVNCGNWM